MQVMKKALIALVLVLASLISIFAGVRFFTVPETYSGTIASIEQKADTVLKLSAASTVAAAAISMFPDDTATPIANKLADFTEYFMLVLCVLFAEKYLLTVIGGMVFCILVPGALLLYGVGTLRNSANFRSYAWKALLFGVALALVIPCSNGVSDQIYRTYQTSIDATISQTQLMTDAASDASLLERLTEAATGLADKAARIVNGYVESLAVMIVTSCGIPVLVLLFFSWVIKLLTGLNLAIPTGRTEPEAPRRIEG